VASRRSYEEELHASLDVMLLAAELDPSVRERHLELVRAVHAGGS
jgi:hypothetical protein